jgi:hypothetical protein
MFKNWEMVDNFVWVMPENEILEKIEANKSENNIPEEN